MTELQLQHSLSCRAFLGGASVRPRTAASRVHAHAQTPPWQVILLLDADFVVSKGLHERLSEERHFKALVEDTTTHRAAVVLPAFETDAALSADEGGMTAYTAQQGVPGGGVSAAPAVLPGRAQPLGSLLAVAHVTATLGSARARGDDCGTDGASRPWP